MKRNKENRNMKIFLFHWNIYSALNCPYMNVKMINFQKIFHELNPFPCSLCSIHLFLPRNLSIICSLSHHWDICYLSIKLNFKFLLHALRTPVYFWLFNSLCCPYGTILSSLKAGWDSAYMHYLTASQET